MLWHQGLKLAAGELGQSELKRERVRVAVGNGAKWQVISPLMRHVCFRLSASLLLRYFKIGSSSCPRAYSKSLGEGSGYGLGCASETGVASLGRDEGYWEMDVRRKFESTAKTSERYRAVGILSASIPPEFTQTEENITNVFAQLQGTVRWSHPIEAAGILGPGSSTTISELTLSRCDRPFGEDNQIRHALSPP